MPYKFIASCLLCGNNPPVAGGNGYCTECIAGLNERALINEWGRQPRRRRWWLLWLK